MNNGSLETAHSILGEERQPLLYVPIGTLPKLGTYNVVPGVSMRASSPKDARRLLPSVSVGEALSEFELALFPQIPVVKVADDEYSHCGRCSESSCDVIASNDVWLKVGRESEDGYPRRENVGERIHLVVTGRVSSYCLGNCDLKLKKAKQTIADTYARFSGSSRFVSFTHVHVMPAHVLARAVRSSEGGR